jgi:hypothetical protein
MLKFSELLVEAREKKPPKEKEFNVNDAKGKLYEILMGSHLHGTFTKGHPNQGKFLQHYRDEDNKRPEDVHNYLRDELEKREPGAYNEIMRHAGEGAEHLKDQLAAHGHHNVNQVAWTSQKGDHQKFTGEDDPNSDADLMVKTENGPVGLSLKYGKTKNMNLRNPGLETLEKAAGLQPNELGKLREDHYAAVRGRGIGIRDHAHYKAMLKGDDQDRGKAADANANALATQKAMAKKVAGGLINKTAARDPDGKIMVDKNGNHITSPEGSEYLRNHIRDTVAPQTTFQHFRLHTRPNGRGGATHHMSDMQDDAANLDDFKDFRVVPHKGDKISYRIEGRRHGSDDYEPVLDQGIKKGSGPMKGFAGMSTAPYLTAADSKKGALTKAPAAAPNRKHGSQGQSITIPSATQQSDDARNAAMSTDGGREPEPRSLSGGSHSGQSFYSPLEQKQLKVGGV